MEWEERKRGKRKRITDREQTKGGRGEERGGHGYILLMQ